MSEQATTGNMFTNTETRVGLDHLGIQVPYDTFDTIVKTYLTILAPIGAKEQFRFNDEPNATRPLVVGMGPPGKAFLWITRSPKDNTTESKPTHIAITADTRAQIDEFHKLAMDAGLKCNGPPGIRAHYHPNYYGAFVLDQVGNNLELVSHCPEA